MDVNTLEGAELDAAVARCEGAEVTIEDDALNIFWPPKPGRICWAEYSPSTSWQQGGPIIERELIAAYRLHGADGWWVAGYNLRVTSGRPEYDSDWGSEPEVEMDHQQTGATALIAAMRAYVASKQAV